MIAEILDEMADAIDAAVNATSGEFPSQVVPRRLFAPTLPCVDMWLGNGGESRSQEEGGMGEIAGAYLFTVRVRVAAADADEERTLLYTFCDDSHERSVAVALEDDQTLNGYASGVYVTGPSEETIYQDVAGQTAYLGVQWRVAVLAVDS